MPSPPVNDNCCFNSSHFFCKAIQCLCGSLNPDIAISNFYAYIAQFLPLKSFSLLSSTPVEHPHEIVVVAHASATKIYCPMHKVPLTQSSKDLIQSLGLNQIQSTEHLITTSQDDYLHYLQYFFPNLSKPVFFLRLLKENVIFGSAHFQGSQPFTEEQLQWMRGLEAPLCIAMGNLLQHRELQEIKTTILKDNQRLRRELQGLNSVDIIGTKHGLKQVMQKVRQIAPVNVPVLISGETGTGKEVIVKAIHELSLRHNEPFVTVNYGALPPTLIDSELFGFTRGAFTGADEIGELPLEAQARLLRVLETHEIEKIGANGPLKLNIRLIAATNRILSDMVIAGTFRKDLYFQLHTIEIILPPLRERQEDIPELAYFLLQQSAAKFGLAVPTLTNAGLEALITYNWPGNIRELQNILEEALICTESRPLCPGKIIKSQQISPDLLPAQANLSNNSFSTSKNNFPTYNEVLQDYFKCLLQSTQGCISGKKGAALKAALKPGTFRFKCTQLGLLPESTPK